MNQTRLNVRIEGVMADHVDGLIEKKLYNSQSEYVRDLIRHDMDKDSADALSASVQRGLDDIENGRYKPYNEDEFLKMMNED